MCKADLKWPSPIKKTGHLGARALFKESINMLQNYIQGGESVTQACHRVNEKRM